MLAAPYGVFALLAALVVEAPSTDLFAALGMYALSVIIGLVLMIGVYLLLVWLFTKKTPSFFSMEWPLHSYWHFLPALVRQPCQLPWSGWKNT